MRLHRRQPTRLPRPWDSSGKNTGMGCHFLLQCMKVKRESEVTVVSDSSDPMDCSPPGSSVHGIFQARVLEWGAIAFSAKHLLGTSKSLQKKHMISSGLSHGSQEIKRGREGAAPGASGAWGPGHLWLEKGSHSLLQGTFPTQGSNPGLLHCRQILYHLSLQESPRLRCIPAWTQTTSLSVNSQMC